VSHAPLFPSTAATLPAQAAPTGLPDLAELERRVARSKAVAWCLVAGLPVLGVVASLLAHLPLFAALMAGCFLLGTALVSARAMATFTGKTLRLLVAARLVVVLIVGALLFCMSGSAWSGVVSAVLLWLAADRLLGRRALFDLWKLVRSPK
jgi:hypothetical protein